ncbi:3-deoxy-7-phosphoheptulonate synthase [Apiospora saccharicola]
MAIRGVMSQEEIRAHQLDENCGRLAQEVFLHSSKAPDEAEGGLRVMRNTLSRKPPNDPFLETREYPESAGTASVGWKGLINDPDIDQSFAINKITPIKRKYVRRWIVQTIDTNTPLVLADLIPVEAIDTRKTELPLRRELDAGLTFNSTSPHRSEHQSE